MSRANHVKQSTYETPLLAAISDLVTLMSSHQFQSLLGAGLANGHSFRENRVLYLLGQFGSCRPSALAEAESTGRANISKILQRLEADGLVKSTVDQTDTRAVLYELTIRGHEMNREFLSIGDDMIRTITADWAPDEVLVLERLVVRLRGAALDYMLTRTSS